MREMKVTRLLPKDLDKNVVKLVDENNLKVPDLAYAICLQFQKYGLCPCPLKGLIQQCELLEPSKSE